jgi:hypothetical protein
VDIGDTTVLELFQANRWCSGTLNKAQIWRKISGCRSNSQLMHKHKRNRRLKILPFSITLHCNQQQSQIYIGQIDWICNTRLQEFMCINLSEKVENVDYGVDRGYKRGTVTQCKSW